MHAHSSSARTVSVQGHFGTAAAAAAAAADAATNNGQWYTIEMTMNAAF